MFKHTVAALTLVLSSMASADTLTYVVDYESMSDIDPTTLAECKAPEMVQIQTDSDSEFVDQVLSQFHWLLSFHAFTQGSKPQILEVEGRDARYAGAYLQTEFTVSPDGLSTQGLFRIDAFGPSQTPTGLVINSEIVGGEAKAGEEYPGPNCGELWYRLEK